MDAIEDGPRTALEARSHGIEPEVVRDIFWRLVALSHWAQREGAAGRHG